MRESSLVHKILDYLQKKGFYARKFHGGSFTRSGTPDILACINGMFVGLEVKVDDNKLTKLQELNLKKIRDGGGFGIEVRNFKEAKYTIDEIMTISKNMVFDYASYVNEVWK
jgi:hypothetical protein